LLGSSRRRCIENVPAFRSWGPTDGNGKAIKKRRGEIYRKYLEMLEAKGA